MHLGPSLVADEQALEIVQPGEGALHHPAHAPQSRAVPGLAAGDKGRDAQLAQLVAVAVGVVASISDDACRATARMADSACHRGYGPEQGEQLLDVVAVRAGQAPGERETARIDEEVLL